MVTALCLEAAMSPAERESLGARLKAIREAAGLSQQELAMRAGVSLSVVFQLEQGKRKDPKLSTLVALAGALGTDVGKLALELTRQPPAPKRKRRKG
jgi:transcriptional regulator with XRE-family HTH domain